jgi:signal transduction histidine kinase
MQRNLWIALESAASFSRASCTARNRAIVHRHSGGSIVDISLSSDAEQVRLEIKDNGRGIPEQRLNRLIDGAAEAGVGVAGMRERIRELGGSLKIQSNGAGTKIIVTIPLLYILMQAAKIFWQIEVDFDAATLGKSVYVPASCGPKA